ncbi:alcohol dehydrogenase catalytic domain-containing protein [Pseudactinotalea terrae]|uniref:alcohol dehydrogenase catalytic domain-containing protein n=1 Tax=Pseudactinotalea terrae TaxID=1743262 RepID=UPI0013912CE4|nr:alcohol dehydrogenase catalytic domain-containing protein [Pseudactinotalea terrae]
MRAARWHGRQDVRVEEVPDPEPARDELILDVLWCGICGTDLEEYREGPITIPIDPHPLRGTRAPIVLGHEIVGTVRQAAADGSGPAVGTLVVPDVVIGCGDCWWCLRHEEGLCPNLAVRGQTQDGGLAQRMVARASTCLTVPEGTPAADAALVEPASVAVRALRKVPDLIGARIGVVGGGTVGQLVARTALALGAQVTVVVDPRQSRRDRALAHGAATAVPPAEAAGLGAVCDAVIECSGAGGALTQALALTRPGGTVVALGIKSEADTIGTTALVLSEKHLVGSAAHLWDVDSRPALALIASGAVPVEDLVTHRVPLADVVTAGFGALADPSDDVLKVLVDCR